MKPQTAFRLAMLANGYWPLLNNCKRSIGQKWQEKAPTEADILAWDRSALTSTGLMIDGDLGVIDVDVTEAALVRALAEAMDARWPALFRQGRVRHSGGVKEAWFARVDQPFRRFASRIWEDPTDITHCVECYGSLKTRQFGIDGPHSRGDWGCVLTTYQFTGGASPATVPRAALPVLPQAAFVAACNVFDEIAQGAGLMAVKTAPNGSADSTLAFDLTDEMIFENASGTYQLDELEAARAAARHQGRDFRVTSSFLGHGTNPTKCSVIYSHRYRCIGVHDFETGITHLPAARAPSALFRLLGHMRQGDRGHGF